MQVAKKEVILRMAIDVHICSMNRQKRDVTVPHSR